MFPFILNQYTPPLFFKGPQWKSFKTFLCYPCHRTLPQLQLLQFLTFMNLYFVYISVRNRCGTPLESAWQRQMETISKNINSSNDMKTQTSKCHTFSVLLFHQISLYMQCSHEFLHLRIIM